MKIYEVKRRQLQRMEHRQFQIFVFYPFEVGHYQKEFITVWDKKKNSFYLTEASSWLTAKGLPKMAGELDYKNNQEEVFTQLFEKLFTARYVYLKK